MSSRAGRMRGAAGGHQRRPGGRLNLWIGGLLVALVVVVALVGLVYLPYPPKTMDFAARLASPSAHHLLGTDLYGRDVLSRVMVGAREALLTGSVAVSIAVLIGVPIGLWGGFRGGWPDELGMRFMDALYAFPVVLSALLFAAILGPGLVTAMLAIGLASAPIFARLTRSSVLTLKSQPFVEAERALGAAPTRIMLRHLLPNALGPLVVQVSQSFSTAILADAALSFLGLGIQPPNPSWGSMLREAQGFIQLVPYGVIWPGLAIAVTVLGFNLLGDGLRDLLDRNGWW